MCSGPLDDGTVRQRFVVILRIMELSGRDSLGMEMSGCGGMWSPG